MIDASSASATIIEIVKFDCPSTYLAYSGTLVCNMLLDALYTNVTKRTMRSFVRADGI